MGILKIHMDYPDGFPVKLIVFQDPYNLELQKDNFENVLNLQFLISEYEFNPAHENILLKVRKENGEVLPYGEKGEIFIHSPLRMINYLHDMHKVWFKSFFN